MNQDPEYRKLKGEGNCKNKPIHRQRKGTLQDVIRPVHADCQEAFERLKIPSSFSVQLIVDDDVSLSSNEGDVDVSDIEA